MRRTSGRMSSSRRAIGGVRFAPHMGTYVPCCRRSPSAMSRRSWQTFRAWDSTRRRCWPSSGTVARLSRVCARAGWCESCTTVIEPRRTLTVAVDDRASRTLQGQRAIRAVAASCMVGAPPPCSVAWRAPAPGSRSPPPAGVPTALEVQTARPDGVGGRQPVVVPPQDVSRIYRTASRPTRPSQASPAHR